MLGIQLFSYSLRAILSGLITSLDQSIIFKPEMRFQTLLVKLEAICSRLNYPRRSYWRLPQLLLLLKLLPVLVLLLEQIQPKMLVVWIDELLPEQLIFQANFLIQYLYYAPRVVFG
ncbi:Hypothetical_protein [Hexamita inflata]|uniref:Hypothetical_protein n=1 Tax=Hexamita inflata TaxID=28002 RepID=A0AA86TK46_9EUKA|nr:Hypothetical protein HINF_LOCUS3033 [Hexamita inflata]